MGKNLTDQEVNKIGWKFLRIMEIEINIWNPFSSRYYTKASFQEAAAKEIIDKLFTEDEKKKLTSLMEEFEEISLNKTSLVPETAAKGIEIYINRHIGTVTGKIFKNIYEKVSPEALNLLGIIMIKNDYTHLAEHFPESYSLFARLLADLHTEHGPQYQMKTVKGYFSKALRELEKFVRGRRKKKPEEETTTNNSEFKPDHTGNQTEKESGENENEETDSSENETDLDNDNQDSSLEKLRTDAIAEISQVMQETKITDQDLAETDRQWKILINSNPADYINKLKERLLVVIQQKQKEKINDEELSKLIQKGEREDNSEELKKIIEQIEGFRGEKVYDTLKEKINALKNKLAEQDIEGYRNANKEMVEQELKDEEIKENELDTEVQKNLEKLRKGGIKQAEIDTIKDEVSNNIKLKSAERKLKKLLEDYQNNPSDEKKKEIIAFTKNSNSFYQKVYELEKDKVDSLLKNSGSSQKKNTSESSFPVNAKYIFGGMTIVAVIFILAEVIKKKKTRSYRN